MKRRGVSFFLLVVVVVVAVVDECMFSYTHKILWVIRLSRTGQNLSVGLIWVFKLTNFNLSRIFFSFGKFLLEPNSSDLSPPRICCLVG